jgi:hypothetical protein
MTMSEPKDILEQLKAATRDIREARHLGDRVRESEAFTRLDNAWAALILARGHSNATH